MGINWSKLREYSVLKVLLGNQRTLNGQSPLSFGQDWAIENAWLFQIHCSIGFEEY